MSDFALNKKEKSKGVYGKRTTLLETMFLTKRNQRLFLNKKSILSTIQSMQKMMNIGKKIVLKN
jgi:hypothetical protein